MIGFALFAAPLFYPPVLALAWAVTVGGVLQLIYQLPHLKKIGMLVLPRVNFRDAGRCASSSKWARRSLGYLSARFH